MSIFLPFCPLLCGHRTNLILEHIKHCKNKHLLNVKFFQCPYNPTHIFGKKAFKMHVDRCPDRFKNIDTNEEKKEEQEQEKKEEEKKERKKKKEKEENTKNEEKKEKIVVKRTLIEKNEKEREIIVVNKKKTNKKKEDENEEEYKKDENNDEKEEEKKEEENKKDEKNEEKKEENKEEENEKKKGKELEDEKEENIIIEDEERENDNFKKNNNIFSPKRHLTSSNLERYHRHLALRDLLFSPESKKLRKISENINNKLKEKKKKEEEIEKNNELLKIHENVKEINESNSHSKNNSSKNLIFKGILKHNLENLQENNKIRKHNSSHKVTIFLNTTRNEPKKRDSIISFDDDSDNNNSENDIQITGVKFKRGRKRSVTFKHFVKVFVFDENKNKHIPKRSVFAKSHLKKQPEDDFEDISSVYMKSL